MFNLKSNALGSKVLPLTLWSSSSPLHAFLKMMDLRVGQPHRYFSSLGVGSRHHFLSSVFVLLKVRGLVLVFSLAENCHAKTDGKHSYYKMRNLVFVLPGELARQRKEPEILLSSAVCSEMSGAYKTQSRAAMSETWKIAGTLEIKAKVELYLCFCGVPRTQTETCVFV